MSNPALRLNGLEPVSEDSSSISPVSRKSLHQNIIGKLRPLPFQYHWTVWFDKHTDSGNYEGRLSVLHEDVSDIATFYRVYNNYPWDKVKLRDTVHIFRKGVKPTWEDPENTNGGCWTFRVPKSKSQDFFHEIAILCMANEFQAALESGMFIFRSYQCAFIQYLLMLPEHDHVVGVSTSARFNSHLISIWNKGGSNQKAIKALEETIMDRLSPELKPASSNSYFYKRHDEHDGFKEAVNRKEAETQSATETGK